MTNVILPKIKGEISYPPANEAMELLVSVITPNWNGARFLEDTILSVLGQSYQNVEYIVIDGGSIDGSNEIIERYKESISYFISERDNGMYEAVNKGMKRASGEIVAYLNSDDLYHKDTISKVVDIFQANPDVDFIFGDLHYIDDQSRKLYSMRFPSFNLTRFVNANYSLIGQPSAFWRRSLFDRIGFFDESLKMASDFDFFIRACSTSRSLHVRVILAAFRVHSDSLSSNQISLNQDEAKRIRSFYINKISNKWYLSAFVSDIMFKLFNWRSFGSKILLRLSNKK